MHYSIFSLIGRELREPKLATEFYVAKECGITSVAVLEKGYLDGANIGRNTTIVLSNYLLPGNIP